MLGLNDWFAERALLIRKIREENQVRDPNCDYCPKCQKSEVGAAGMICSTCKQLAPLNALATRCHEANKTWWIDLATGQYKERNVGELLMLCVSELAEALRLAGVFGGEGDYVQGEGI